MPEPCTQGSDDGHRAGNRALGAGLTLAGTSGVTHHNPIEPKPVSVRHLRSGGRTIAVELFRNEGGSFAARCHLGDSDMPIIDGPSEEEVLAAVADALEGLLFARAVG